MNKALIFALFVACAYCVPISQGPKPPGSDCDICETLISAIEGWLEANATEEQIISDFETLCNLVPLWTSVCDQMIVYGIKDIVKYVQDDQPPEVVCAEVGICSGGNTQKKVQRIKDENCFLCETVIETIEDWVEQNASIQEIEQDLETVCTLVPGLEAQCDAIVEQGVPQVVTWIEKNESPTQVCDQLGFCNATVAKAKGHKSHHHKIHHKTTKVLPKKPTDLPCTICEGIISAMESWVENNQTTAEIIQNLDQLCGLLGNPPQCLAIVAIGVNDIIDMIKKDYTPVQVCQQLNFCTTLPKIFKPTNPIKM